MRKYKLILALLAVALLLAISKATPAATFAAALPYPLIPQELITPAQMGTDPAGNPLYSSFSQWFQAKTTLTWVSEEWFGAYNFLADDDKLYISFGRGRPAEFC